MERPGKNAPTGRAVDAAPTRSNTIQPFIITVGSTPDKLQRSYCVVDIIKHDFQNLKQAFDICFKAFFALHPNYPYEAYNSWLFVQQTLYDIRLTCDRKSSQVSSLKSNFQFLMKENSASS